MFKPGVVEFNSTVWNSFSILSCFICQPPIEPLNSSIVPLIAKILLEGSKWNRLYLSRMFLLDALIYWLPALPIKNASALTSNSFGFVLNLK